MGSIDLDPASSALANETVKATHYYSKEDNGLEQPWRGRIWLNPPFKRSQTPGKKTGQGFWIRKLLDEYERGNIDQAVLLTTCRPDTSWFEPLLDFPVCNCRYKVGFYVPEEGQILQVHSHMHGTLFIYLGMWEQQFIDNFSQFGRITKAIDMPKERLIHESLWLESAGVA